MFRLLKIICFYFYLWKKHDCHLWSLLSRLQRIVSSLVRISHQVKFVWKIKVKSIISWIRSFSPFSLVSRSLFLSNFVYSSTECIVLISTNIESTELLIFRVNSCDIKKIQEGGKSKAFICVRLSNKMPNMRINTHTHKM